MSGRVPYTASTETVKNVRRWGKEHGFKYGDETWTFVRQGEKEVALFEQTGFEAAAEQLCRFLNGLPQADADAVIAAIGNAAVAAHLREASTRRAGGRYNDS